MLEFEHKLIAQGKTLIAGIDEAGRGPLAGPVSCACVIMPLGEKDIIEGVNDSKKLSEKKREELYDKIIEKAYSYSVVFVDEKTIDEVNILNATKQGMIQCLEELSLKPEVVLVDAVKLNIETENHGIIHGDALSYSIACASILAKVERDRYMQSISARYQNYNFAKHKGYGTKEHIQAIKQFGICEIHRKTFVKNFTNVS